MAACGLVAVLPLLFWISVAARVSSDRGARDGVNSAFPMASEIPQPGATSSIEDQIRLREQKADQLREKGAASVRQRCRGAAHHGDRPRSGTRTTMRRLLEAQHTEPYGSSRPGLMALRSMVKRRAFSRCAIDNRRSTDLRQEGQGGRAGGTSLLKLADHGRHRLRARAGDADEDRRAVR